MALFQALLALLSRSAGTILNAVFGWAVLALFGKTSPKQQTILSGVVGMAAAWPLLALGIVVPRVTTFLIAFVPLSNHVPKLAIRIVWGTLAVVVPVLVGLVVASKAPPGSPRESFVMRVLRGFPITLGIATAFVSMFFTVPALRISSMVHGRQDEHAPSITEGGGYEVVARQIDDILRRYGLEATRTNPSGWLSGPATVMRALCGKSLRGFLPDELAYWKGPTLEVAFYPSDVLIRGKQENAAWIHGILVEQLVFGPELQTFDPNAQKVERHIRSLLGKKVRSAVPEHELHDVVEELGKLSGVAYDDWQALYRQLGQLGRVLSGQQQLLELHLDQKRGQQIAS